MTLFNFNENGYDLRIVIFLAIILIIAVYTDIKKKRIPNYLTFTGVLMGLFFHFLEEGLRGLIFSVHGAVLGMALLFIPYIIGGMGAGDAKLMGAIGAFLGPKGVFIAFLSSAIVGGIYALILLVLHGYIKDTLLRYGAIIKTYLFTKKVIYVPPSQKEQKPKLSYGVAIAIGTIISIVFFQKFM